jgi:hypothetical protein
MALIPGFNYEGLIEPHNPLKYSRKSKEELQEIFEELDYKKKKSRKPKRNFDFLVSPVCKEDMPWSW